MIDRLYELLGKMGYIHPLHPPFTHGPIGAVIVAFCFGWHVVMATAKFFSVCLLCCRHRSCTALPHCVGRDYGLAILLFRGLDISDTTEDRSGHSPVHTLIDYLNCRANSECTSVDHDAFAYTLSF